VKSENLYNITKNPPFIPLFQRGKSPLSPPFRKGGIRKGDFIAREKIKLCYDFRKVISEIF